MPRHRTWIFENGLGALGYRWLTEQPLWRRQIAGLLDHFDPTIAAPRVLDLGCGPGVSTFVLAEALGPGAEVVGVDISTVMIDRANALHAARHRHLHALRFVCADAVALPFADGAFDVVTGHSFLYIIGERERALREIARVLAPGGRLILMEPARDGSLLRAARDALPALPSSLREPRTSVQFAASMVLWRAFSSLAGRITPALVDELFARAGLETVATVPTLAGLGWHCVARRPLADGRARAPSA
ncbi:MAG: class I SAM-dependent methyltransferase [Myxococcales bacterium]|nr:class I SAM-dependent methyltransferase [Myxococcales bacterium]